MSRAMRMNGARKPNKPPLRQRERDTGEIRHGTVGWDDGGDHFDLEPEGIPLLKVTLFAGHNTEQQGLNTEPTRARGMQILVRFNGRMSDIPKDGTHVIVVRPAGMEQTPGSYFLLQTVENDPKLVPNRKDGEKIIYGPKDSFVRFKEDGTIFMFVASSDEENAPPVFVKLSKTGWEVRHPHGRARVDKLGFEMAHSSGAAISGGAVSGAPAPLDAFSSFLNLRADMVKVEAAVIGLGPDSASPDMLIKYTPLLSAINALESYIEAAHAALISMNTTLGLTITGVGTLPGGAAAMSAAASSETTTSAAVSSISAAESASLAGVATLTATGGTSSVAGG